MKTPPKRSSDTRPFAQRLFEWLRWLDHELECGMLDLGLFVRGERRVVTAEMVLVFLLELILLVVFILVLSLWGMFLKYLGIGA